MYLAPVCFFSEADARLCGQKAGREAAGLWRENNAERIQNADARV